MTRDSISSERIRGRSQSAEYMYSKPLYGKRIRGLRVLLSPGPEEMADKDVPLPAPGPLGTDHASDLELCVRVSQVVVQTTPHSKDPTSSNFHLNSSLLNTLSSYQHW